MKILKCDPLRHIDLFMLMLYIQANNFSVMSDIFLFMFINNEKLFAAIVNFQKAFDYIVHDILWFKLVEIGVRGKLLNVIAFVENCQFIQTQSQELSLIIL